MLSRPLSSVMRYLLEHNESRSSRISSSILPIVRMFAALDTSRISEKMFKIYIAVFTHQPYTTCTRSAAPWPQRQLRFRTYIAFQIKQLECTVKNMLRCLYFHPKHPIWDCWSIHREGLRCCCSLVTLVDETTEAEAWGLTLQL